MLTVTKRVFTVLPNPVPLGASGKVTIPLERYLALVGQEPDTKSSLLLDDEDRVAYIAHRISQILDFDPRDAAEAISLRHGILAHFPEINVAGFFAEKAFETLLDGQYHNRTLVAPDETRAAILFNARYGTARQHQRARYGNYFGPMLSTVKNLVDRGIAVGGLLQIDAFVMDNPDVKAPAKPLAEVFELDLEFSYIPGYFVGCINKAAASLPTGAMFVPGLLTPEQVRAIEKPFGR